MRPVTDHQTTRDIQSSSGQSVQFFQQRKRTDDDSRRDDGPDVTVQNAGREQTELVSSAVKLDRMARIVPALIADHNIMFFRQQVNDFALGFVAPLQTNHRSCRHRNARWGERLSETKERKKTGHRLAPKSGRECS